MGHVHDTEMSRWKTPCAVKTKTWHINVTELDRGRVVVDVEYSSASWLLACYQGHSKMRMVYGHVLVNFNWTRSILGETWRVGNLIRLSTLSSLAEAAITSCAPWFTLGTAAPFDAKICALPRGTWENFKAIGVSRRSLCTSNSGIILRQNVGHFTPHFSENCVFPIVVVERRGLLMYALWKYQSAYIHGKNKVMALLFYAITH